MEYIQGVPRDQVILFPEIVDEYVEEENPVRVIDAFVNKLNLKKLGFAHARVKECGRPPYDPADMLKLQIYGLMNNLRSSRALERETKRNVELMWLLRKVTPDHKTIANFRKNNTKALKQVLREFTRFLRELGLIAGELVAVDGCQRRSKVDPPLPV